MVMERSLGRMVIFMRAISRQESATGMARESTWMAQSTQVTIMRINRMEEDCTFGKMESGTRETGQMENSMAKELKHYLMAQFSTETGKKVDLLARVCASTLMEQSILVVGLTVSHME
jgi:hypothetical protein